MATGRFAVANRKSTSGNSSPVEAAQPKSSPTPEPVQFLNDLTSYFCLSHLTFSTILFYAFIRAPSLKGAACLYLLGSFGIKS